MGKLTKSMRRTDKAIKSMLDAQKLSDKRFKAMIDARPRIDKKFERLIARLKRDRKGHRKRR